MSRRSWALGLGLGLGVGLAGAALYRFRRRLIGWLLHLPPAQNDVAVERDLPVPMPDGVLLRADHYRPKTSGAFPTILIRSPYGRGREAGRFGRGFAFLAERFAERGYHVVVQGVRGRFDSQGEFQVLVHEADDGRATLDWLSAQPWFNGVLGMWGPSYLGYVQWAVAVEAPLQVQALVPIIAFSRGYSAAYLDGAVALDLMLRGLFIFDDRGGRRPRSPAGERRRWRRMEEILAPAFRHLPLIEADTLVVGEPVPYYREGLTHPEETDPFWQALDCHRRLERVTAPVHLISGWYDLFLRDLLADYEALRAAGRSPYLTIGPWYHMDLNWLPLALREGIIWFDAHLRGDRRLLRRKPVRIYVMGAEGWREYDAWPPPAVERRYYLHAEGRLSPEVPEASSPPDAYRYDPADPTPGWGGNFFLPPACGRKDNRPLEARPDVLCYTTPPLKAAVEVIGPVRLELYISSSRPYTDFFGRLCDVYPDGRSINICDGLFRVAPGRGEPQPDGGRRIVVDMWATAHRFLPGHRLRLQVSSGAHPRWNRNLGTGEPEATATRMVAAEQTVYHDSEHPSALVLPVASG